jgi:hypothetical protein
MECIDTKIRKQNKPILMGERKKNELQGAIVDCQKPLLVVNIAMFEINDITDTTLVAS